MNAPRVGLPVIANGYPGTITRVCEWSDSMVEVRLASGTVCVDYNGIDCAPADGWAMRSVGCHWTHPKYPQAVVSTVSRPNSRARFSGYVAVVNFSEIGLFATSELAQRAVEALLGGDV